MSSTGSEAFLMHDKTQINSKDNILQPQSEHHALVSKSDTRPYDKRKGTSGMSGQLYEIKLLMDFLLKGLESEKDFYLATNMEKAGDFDDVVFLYKYEDKDGNQKSKTIFLQAKHRENGNTEIPLTNLVDENKKPDFCIKKYFRSYREIKKEFYQRKSEYDPIFESDFNDTEFVIFTNAPFKYDTAEERNIASRNFEENIVLNVMRDENQYFRLKFDGTNKDRIIETLSDCKKLAKELAKCSFSKKEIGLNKTIFKKYHIPLANKVIQKVNETEGRFEPEFIDGNESLSSDTKIFRKIFLEEIQKIEESNKNSTGDLQSKLKFTSLKLQDKFFKVERDLTLQLPCELINETEMEEFLNKFKLFDSLRNEEELEERLKQKIKSTYCVGETELDSVFSVVKNRIEKWWKNKNGEYLTKTNRFFQDSTRNYSTRTSFWFEVKEPVDSFTGRKQELSELHNKVQRYSGKITVTSQITVISGLGGIGKTELARQYVQEYRENYDKNIIWVNAESEGTLADSFIRFATVNDKLGIRAKNEIGKPSEDVESIVDIVRKIYEYFGKRKSLFIFDNADDGKYLWKFLCLLSYLSSDHNKPYILITSRNTEWKEGIEVMDLHKLTLVDAVNFVKKGLGLESDLQEEDIKALVEKLQLFPLAMQQAVAYIKDQNKTRDFEINDYMEEYEQKTKDLLDSKLFQGTDNNYSRTTYTTWKITIDKIRSDEKYGDIALEILQVIAYFAPEKIERKMFLSVAGRDDEQLREVVRLLVKYSLVNGEQKQSVLSMHRLVQEVIRLELKAQNKEIETLRSSLELINRACVEEESANHITSIWSYASEHNELIDIYFKSPYVEKMTPLHLLARNGLTEAVNKVIKRIKETFPDQLYEMVNMPDGSWYNITPLHEAAQYGYIDVVKLLVNSGAKIDSDDRDGWNPCVLAMRHNNWEIADYLRVSYYIIIHLILYSLFNTRPVGNAKTLVGYAESILGRNTLEKEYNKYILSKKIERSQIDKLNIIKILIEDRSKKINIHEPDKITRRTPLIDYCKQGELGVVKYLLEEAGANILDRDNERSTALHSAAGNNRLHIVEYLVGYMQKSKMNINPIDQYGATPLFAAALYYHRDVITFLISKGAIADIVSDKEMIIGKLHTTLLHLAAIYDDKKMAKFLIEEKGLDKDVGKGISYTPLHAAALFNNQKVINYLLDEGADVNVDINVVNFRSAFGDMKASINKSVGDRLPPFNSIVGLLEKNSSTPYAICKARGFRNRRLQEATAECSTDTTCLKSVLNKLISDEIIRQWIMFVKKKKDEISRKDVNISEQAPGSESNNIDLVKNI